MDTRKPSRHVCINGNYLKSVSSKIIKLLLKGITYTITLRDCKSELPRNSLAYEVKMYPK